MSMVTPTAGETLARLYDAHEAELQDHLDRLKMGVHLHDELHRHGVRPMDAPTDLLGWVDAMAATALHLPVVTTELELDRAPEALAYLILNRAHQVAELIWEHAPGEDVVGEALQLAGELITMASTARPGVLDAHRARWATSHVDGIKGLEGAQNKAHSKGDKRGGR